MKPKYLEISEEDMQKVLRRKKQDEIKEVPLEWRLLAEFGFYYGWQAVKDVRENEIDTETFNMLLAGARKVNAQEMLNLSTVMYTSIVATKSKKPNTVINNGLSRFRKEAR